MYVITERQRALHTDQKFGVPIQIYNAFTTRRYRFEAIRIEQANEMARSERCVGGGRGNAPDSIIQTEHNIFSNLIWKLWAVEQVDSNWNAEFNVRAVGRTHKCLEIERMENSAAIGIIQTSAYKSTFVFGLLLSLTPPVQDSRPQSAQPIHPKHKNTPAIIMFSIWKAAGPISLAEPCRSGSLAFVLLQRVLSPTKDLLINQSHARRRRFAYTVSMVEDVLYVCIGWVFSHH